MSKNKPTEIRISVRADEELAARIDAAAKANGISGADIVRMAIKRYLPEAQKKAA